mgnify:CR=1 FL=1
MKKLFIFTVDNTIDLITNSSSELFVLKGDTQEIVEEMIRSVYPDFRSEYEAVKHISALSVDELDSYMNWATGSYCWPAKKTDYHIPDGFTFEELYEPDGKDAAWNGEIQYRLKNNLPLKDRKWEFDSAFVTEKNYEEVLNKLDPERKMYFLYSIDENPNWDMQEQLMGIATRYHLG